MKGSQTCVACGGKLVFEPKKQVLKCVQCGALTAVKGVVTTEKSFERLLKNAPQWQMETIVYRCDHCGAKSVMNKTDLVKRCEYCGATTMIKSEDHPGLYPDTVVLFKLNRDEAVEKARRWLARRRLAPNWYKRMAQAKNLRAFYFPAFTFDAQTMSSYTGYQTTTHTRTTFQDGQAVESTYTTRTPVRGHLPKVFDDLLISATSTISPTLFNDLQPFLTNEANVYQKEYLSGYSVAVADQDPLRCWDAAKQSMHTTIKTEIQNGFTASVEGLVVNTTMTNITYKYVLLPVFVGHTEYKGEKYELYINGQSGKTVGKSPVSIWKVLGLAAMGIGLVAAGFLLAFLL